jgi:hypothetical protein
VYNSPSVSAIYASGSIDITFTPPVTTGYVFTEIWLSTDDTTYTLVGQDSDGNFNLNGLGTYYQPGDTVYIKLRSVSFMGIKEEIPTDYHSAVSITAGSGAIISDHLGTNSVITTKVADDNITRRWSVYWDAPASYVTLTDTNWTDLASQALTPSDDDLLLTTTCAFQASTLNDVTDKVRFDIRFAIGGVSTSAWFGPYLTGYMDYTGIVNQIIPANYLVSSPGTSGVTMKVQARFLMIAGALTDEYVRATKCSFSILETKK